MFFLKSGRHFEVYCPIKQQYIKQQYMVHT